MSDIYKIPKYDEIYADGDDGTAVAASRREPLNFEVPFPDDPNPPIPDAE
jgi:hypothetical protein